MPVLDGYNATRAIRAHPDPIVREVLVIAMTASAIRGDKEKCLEAGMNNYLAKPVRAHVLKQMLEGYLNQAPKTMKDLQQQANMVSQEVLGEVALYASPTTSAAAAAAAVNGAEVDGNGVVDGERDGLETPTLTSGTVVDSALPALPSRNKSAFKVVQQ